MQEESIKEALLDIKTELKALAKVITEQKILEQKLIAANLKHDEGRRVLHKRIDLFSKAAFWFGTTLFTGMISVIYVLVGKVVGI